MMKLKDNIQKMLLRGQWQNTVWQTQRHSMVHPSVSQREQHIL